MEIAGQAVHQEREVENTGDAGKGSTPPGTMLWAYAYQMIPPQAEDLMERVRILLAEENEEARFGAGTWVARMVVEPQVTHVLVVSDSPELNRQLNSRLETSLKEMAVRFSVTVPMPLGGGAGHTEE